MNPILGMVAALSICFTSSGGEPKSLCVDSLIDDSFTLKQRKTPAGDLPSFRDTGEAKKNGKKSNCQDCNTHLSVPGTRPEFLSCWA